MGSKAQKTKPGRSSAPQLVYVVHRQCFDDYEVMGVYETKYLANKDINKWYKEFPQGVSFYYVLEFEVKRGSKKR